MVLYLVKVYVKEGNEDAFIKASLLNKAGSEKEEGVVQFDMADTSRMNQLEQFPVAVFNTDHNPGTLHAAARGAGTGTHEHTKK